MSKEITIAKEIDPIVTRAQSLKIDADSLPEAVELLSALNRQNDRIQAEKERITKPLNEALKTERGRWKPFETILDEAINTIRAKMTIYQTEAKKKADTEAQAIASRIGPGRGKLTIETASIKLANIDTPEATTATDSGSVTFRTIQKWRVTKLEEIPYARLIPNDALISADMKAGRPVPGIEYYTEEQVINRRTL